MLIFYNIYFKGVYLLGNFAVGLVIGMSFIFSGAAHYSIAPMWIPAFLAFGLTFLREIIKDLEDIKGDKISGLLTYPISSDLKQTTRLIILIAASVVSITHSILFGNSNDIAFSSIIIITVSILL